MSDLLEVQIENTVVEEAKRLGFKVRKVCWFGGRNAPDRLFTKPGRGFFCEFKAPGEEPRPGQEREIGRLRAAGFEVHVIDNVADGIEMLKGEARC